MTLDGFFQLMTALFTAVGLWLIYTQVRSANESLRSTAYQGVVAHSLTLIENVIARDETLKAIAKAIGYTGDLEQLRLHFMFVATYRHFENLYLQYRLGSIDESQWVGYRALLGHYATREGFAKWWSVTAHQQWFSETFRDELARIVASYPMQSARLRRSRLVPRLPSRLRDG